MSTENNQGETNQMSKEEVGVSKRSKIPNVTIINVVLLVGLLVLYALYFYPTLTSPNATVLADESAQIEEKIAGEALDIAYVNSDTLMSKYTLAKKMRADFETEQKRLENDLKNKQTSFQTDVETFQRQIQQGSISMEEGQAREQELMQRQQEIIQLNDTYSNRLMMQEMEMNQDLYQKITDLLGRYNQEMDYDYILGFSPGGGILYASKKHDITEDILKRLNDEHDANQ